MKRITTLVIAAMAAFTIGATTITPPAEAGKRERRIAAGIILGAIGGAIIADHANRKRDRRYHRRYDRPARSYGNYYGGHRDYDRRHYREPIFVERRVYSRPRLSRWQRHVNRCYRRYRSYDERSDTFIGYDGIERRCRL